MEYKTGVVNLKKVISDDPECLADERKLKSVLSDCFSDKLLRNVLVMAHDAGIVSDMTKKGDCIDGFTVVAYTKRLTTEYGISDSNAREAIECWCDALNIKVQQKISEADPVAIEIEQPGFYDDLPDTDEIEAVSVNDFKYDSFEYGVKISKFLGFEESCMAIPHEVNGKPVIAIGEGVFQGCNSIEKVILPDEVKYIEKEAFDRCKGLRKVMFPVWLQTIGVSAFQGSSLERVILPDSVRKIDRYAFDGCKKLTTVKLPNGLKEAENSVFSNTSIKYVEIPDGVPLISAYMFENCTELADVRLPETIKEIGPSAFWNTGLTSIDIPSSVTRIASGAFGECRQLGHIGLKEGLREIGGYAFDACAFSSIYIPHTVTSIGDNLFGNRDVTIICHAGSPILEYARRVGIKVQNASNLDGKV